MQQIEEFKNKILYGDCLEILKGIPEESVDCVISSPPYWQLRDYKVEKQIGLEKSKEEYIQKLVDVFKECFRILKPTGTCWINLGDTYMTNSSYADKDRQDYGQRVGFIYKEDEFIKDKSLCLIPQRFAVKMVDEGYILRNTINWVKSNAMPSSVTDRFTVDFENVFFFVKNKFYYFEQQKENNLDTYLGKRGKYINRTKLESSMQTEGFMDYFGKGRNMRTTWEIPTEPLKDAHFAVFPTRLVEICLQAGCPENGIVLDPFFGSGTVGLVARQQDKNFIGIELNPDYIDIAKNRIAPHLIRCNIFE